MAVMVSLCAGTKGRCGTIRAALTEARAAAAADAAFGVDMYQVLAQDAANTVFSPTSVASALRMALCGARGKTAAELARALHLDGADRQDDVAVSALRLVSARRGGGPGSESATFRAPNTVWVQSGLPLRAEFAARLARPRPRSPTPISPRRPRRPGP